MIIMIFTIMCSTLLISLPSALTSHKPDLTCKVHLEDLKDKHSHNGILVRDANDPESCKQACLKRDGCAAVDFNAVNGGCYLHIWKDSLEGKTYPARKITQTRVVRCFGLLSDSVIEEETTTSSDCHPRWLRYEGMHSHFGTEVPEFTSEKDCIVACAEAEDCNAADFNFKNKKCYFHSEANYYDTARWVYGTNQYRMIPCPHIGCRDHWEKYYGTHSFGGTQVRNARTVESCKKVCFDTKDCLAIDFNHQNRECFIHTDKDYLKYEHSSVNYITQYRLVRCEGTESTVDVSPTEAEVSTENTATAQTTTTTDADTSESQTAAVESQPPSATSGETEATSQTTVKTPDSEENNVPDDNESPEQETTAEEEQTGEEEDEEEE